MTDYQDYLKKLILQEHIEQNDEIDAFILKHFGSWEAVEQNGKYWVLETKETTVEKSRSQPFDGHITYKMEVEYRLRPKTKEELEADGIV